MLWKTDWENKKSDKEEAVIPAMRDSCFFLYIGQYNTKCDVFRQSMTMDTIIKNNIVI